MKNLKRGFTLIELLIVIAILAILGSIAVNAYKSYKMKHVSQSQTYTIESSEEAPAQ